MAKKTDGKLTDQQKLFCREYLKDLNGTQAAIRAGYSKKQNVAAVQASNLLKDEKVRAFTMELMNERAKRVELSADYVLENLKEVVERCMQRAPVMVRDGKHMVQLIDEDGNHVWKFDSTGVNTALGLLGRHFKLYTDKVEIKGKLTLADLVAGDEEENKDD